MSQQPFRSLGMWVWEADKDSPDSFCATLAANHYSWVVVKAHDGGGYFNDGALILAWKAACAKHGLRFGVWGYTYSSSDASIAIACVDRFGAEFYVADAETEYEHATGPESANFCAAFRAKHPNLPAALSSFGRIDYHAGIDYAAWRDHGFDFWPQAYECDSSALTPALCVSAALSVWPRDRIFPTLGAYPGALGNLSGQHLYDSITHIPLPGVNVWDAQELTGDQLQKIGLLSHHAPPKPPPPPPKPPPAPLPPWDTARPYRYLQLTSPITSGRDVQHFQQAINDRLGRYGVPALTIDGQFGPLTHHWGRVAAYAIGLTATYEPTIAVQSLVEYPWHRTPVQVACAKKRAYRYGGLAQIPTLAARYIGVAENPPGSNHGLPNPTGWEENFGFDGQPWCGAFAGSMILAAGGHVDSRVAYCPYIEADARGGTNGFDKWVDNHDQGVGPGWLVLYCWDGSGVPEHVGVVESIGSTTLVAIEGNTSGPNPADGGMVARVTRDYGPTVGYARPRF